ncbi:hypothetical protein GQ53DRAFT_823535 [Thozetella sp. PMI_491]|nr:hypothetical protein GQ53DRAFT_823535 [Thozetella sp. PMI_491]
MKLSLATSIIACSSLAMAATGLQGKLVSRDLTSILATLDNLTNIVHSFTTTIKAWPNGTLSPESVAADFNTFLDAEALQVPLFLASTNLTLDEVENGVVPNAAPFRGNITELIETIVGRKAQIAQSNLCTLTRLGLVASSSREQALHDALAEKFPPPYNVYENPAVPLYEGGVLEFTGSNCTDATKSSSGQPASTSAPVAGSAVKLGRRAEKLRVLKNGPAFVT